METHKIITLLILTNMVTAVSTWAFTYLGIKYLRIKKEIDR